MKLKSILTTGLFAAIVALPMGAQAASDMEKTPEAKAPAADMQDQKKMKPHSHVKEKTGMPQNAPEAKSDKTNPATDKSKHFHPRDAM